MSLQWNYIVSRAARHALLRSLRSIATRIDSQIDNHYNRQREREREREYSGFIFTSIYVLNIDIGNNRMRARESCKINNMPDYSF